MNAKELGNQSVGMVVMFEGIEQRNEGMKKREAFAMAAMQGWLASFAGCEQRANEKEIAKRSLQFADALLAELAKETP
jgi:hypothetical protein